MLSLPSSTFLLLILALAPVPHGDLRQRIAALTARIQKAPQSAPLYLQRGELLRLDHRFEAALKDLARGARLDPKLKALHLVRARLYRDVGLQERALREVSLFLKLAPRHGQGHLLLSHMLARGGRLREAAAEARLALSLLAPPRPKDVLWCARSLEQSQGPQAALACLGRWTRTLGGAISLEIAALRLERQSGAIQAALARLTRLARRPGRQEPYLILRAEVLAQAGRDQEARDTLKTARHLILGLPSIVRTRPATRKLLRVVAKRLGHLGKPPATQKKKKESLP